MQRDTINPAVCVSINDLLDMRHRLKDISLFAGPGRSPLTGTHRARLRGRGIEFEHARIYLPGDDVRSIDWRITARTGKPHTKVFQEERERPVFIMAEQSAALFFGTAQCFKSVLAARCAALFAWAALEHNDRVGGLVWTPQQSRLVRPQRNRHHLLQLLGHITELNRSLPAQPLQPQDSSLPTALIQARQSLRPGSLIVLICDERALDIRSERLLVQLSVHCQIILLPVSDPLDHALPNAGPLRFCNDLTQLNIDSSDEQLRRLWRQRARARRQQWQRISQRCNAMLLPLDTATDLLEGLHQQLGRGHL